MVASPRIPVLADPYNKKVTWNYNSPFKESKGNEQKEYKKKKNHFLVHRE